MTSRADTRIGVHPLWWTLGLILLIAVVVAVTALSFSGSLVRSVAVTVKSDRSGLVLDPGGKVKMRGVQVGHVVSLGGGQDSTTLRISLYPQAVRYIPANVHAQIRATTAFGAKYVDLVVPNDPAAQRITAGAVLYSTNVTSEVNTVFENLNAVLRQVDPAKLNAILTALADALRGKGERIGQATVEANEVLAALNDRSDVLRTDLIALSNATETYAAAAPDILKTLSALSTTSTTLTRQAGDLDTALLATIGLARSGTDLLAPNMDNVVRGVNGLRPTTDLLFKYSPEYTCTLQGAKWVLDSFANDAAGGADGRSSMFDIGFINFASDPYKYPTHLPITGAKGGPDGKPGCGSLPRPDLNFPVRALIANTGYGTGLDWRPNPGPAHPFLENFFPVTKAHPQPPRVWGEGPPAIGPVPYPGAPPYGAPLFGPDGTPLWAPPPPGAPPPPVPGVPNPPPPYGTGTGPTVAPPPPVAAEPNSGGQP